MPHLLRTLAHHMMFQMKRATHYAGRRYLDAILRSEFEAQSFRRINERPIEYRFVFDAVRELLPTTVLDVGTGLSALPSLIRTCGPVVTAVDNIHDYWPAGMVNRHFHVQDEDATKAISGKYDLVTCISTLEHVLDHDRAIALMLSALNPGGHLVVTFPYNEREYVRNVYEEPEASYRMDPPVVCQVYSRRELDRWFSNVALVRQEYWRVFSGKLWTLGDTLRPAVQTNRDGLHQLTCVLVRKD